jgi:hypothetical protein
VVRGAGVEVSLGLVMTAHPTFTGNARLHGTLKTSTSFVFMERIR